MARRQPKDKKPAQSGPKKLNRADANVKAINTYEDTLEKGGEDEFQHNRDKILLQDTSNRRSTAPTSDDEFHDEDEVFALKNQPSSDSDDDEQYDDESSLPQKKKKERKPKPAPPTVPKGRFAKAPTSDDDSLGEHSDAPSGPDSNDEDASDSEDDDEGGWGTNANAYYARPSTRRGRDEEESEGDSDLEERRELEDKEARKLQRKGRENMSRGDFGFEDLSKAGEEPAVASVKKSEPDAPLPTDTAGLLRHLEVTAPETLALAREWGDIAERIPKTADAIKARQAEEPDHPSVALMMLHYQTLLTYATALAFYLHLASLPKATRPDLSSHPVLSRLLQLKTALTQLEEEDFDALDAGSDEEDDPDATYGTMPGARGTDWDEDEDAQKLWDEKRDMLGLSDEEMQELMEDLKKEKAGGGREDSEDEEYDSELEEWEKKEKEAAEKSMMQKKAKKSKGEQGEKSKKATKKPTSAFALEEPTPSFASSSRSKSKSKPSSSTAASSSKLPSKAEDVHSEPLALSLADSSAKASARRSLRFHTAKIDSAAQRRSSARQGRMGGDEDIPYRNKQAGRDAALRKNGPKGAGDGGEDLDGMEFGEEDRRVAREVRGGKRGMDEEDGAAEEGDDGYYQLVKKRKRDVKEAKQEAYDEEQAATRVPDVSYTDDGSGPRSLTRAILKNRGLTPHRSKAVRNPRVKKRQRFEKAKKQVSSRQAVYKGGQSALKGAYGGEATGISQVVKSRKFV